MSEKLSLKEAERRAFTISFDDGLWDIFLGCFFLEFVIAPFLSPFLGDFWSSVIFLPFWGLVYLAIWLIRKYIVKPRIGTVKFGPARTAKLKKFTIVMLLVNIIVFFLGVIAFLSVGAVSGQIYPAILGLTLLIAFSFAAYFLDFPRLYIYGLLLALSPLVGEWLFTHGYASHHGWPITFGVTCGIMILTGLIIFIRFLRNNPLPVMETSLEER
jgi:hypothetical protein